MIDDVKKKIFLVNVIIQNKAYLNDPEGETILNDLILKENYHDVISVRSSKSLSIKVLAKSETEAHRKVKNMCDDLRIYNPIVSNCEIMIKRI